MDYTVQRKVSESGGVSSYLLLGANDTELLVADHTEGPPPDSRRQIRLARPSGRLVATIDLPSPTRDGEEDDRKVDYAIIHEYAVYAIISVRHRPLPEEDAGVRNYFLIEVEGETWLVLPHPEQRDCYAFYDEIPSGLHTYESLTELDLPPEFGQACRQDGDGFLIVSLNPRRLFRTDLVVLSLAYLIDQYGAGPAPT